MSERKLYIPRGVVPGRLRLAACERPVEATSGVFPGVPWPHGRKGPFARAHRDGETQHQPMCPSSREPAAVRVAPRSGEWHARCVAVYRSKVFRLLSQASEAGKVVLLAEQNLKSRASRKGRQPGRCLRACDLGRGERLAAGALPLP
jgi:hypothetical protein